MSLTGVVKIFNAQKGFGFITTAEGTDVFLHIKACNTTPDGGGVPVQGDPVMFDLEESKMKPGQMQASNVTGGSGAPPKKGGGVHQGTCKSFVADQGWGFIVGPDGKDIFFHAKGMSDGSAADKGDVLNYDLEESKTKPGQMIAVNVTGGSGWEKGDKGKGKGKGKDKDGWGAAKGGWGGDGGWSDGGWSDGGWGGKGWGSGPYDGGKGKDDGKGKGKGGGKGGGMMDMMMGMINSMWGGKDGGKGGGDGGKGGGDSWGGGKGGW